jgi:DNA-binding response OmpR family regulator
VWQAIHRLRQKIEPDPHTPRYVQNKPGIGYLLAEPDK